MHRYIQLLAIIAGLASGATLPESPRGPGTRIIGGQNANDGDVKSLVQIRFNKTDGWSFCGAVIIDDRHLLTAAHCFYQAIAANLTARVGSKNYGMGQAYSVSKITVHEDFAYVRPFYNDICILTLAQNITFGPYVQPAELALTPPVPGTDTLVKGWGYTSTNTTTLSYYLQKATLQVVSLEDCRAQYLPYNNVSTISDGQMCASNGVKNPCGGDSGGAYYDQQGRAIGIVSWGISCGSGGFPGVATAIHKYIPWIIQKINNN